MLFRSGGFHVAGSNFLTGAVLTLNGIQSVTPCDLSVIVGAKEDEDVVRGDFTFRSNMNKLYLLFDHLFTALKFKFMVDATYNALRTIKITKLELLAFTGDSETRLKSKYNVTITFKRNDTGASPVESVVFTPDGTSAPMDYQTLYSGNEVELKAEAETSFMGCFVPGSQTNFKLRTTYNVYDKQGNRIREGCEAVNAINLDGGGTTALMFMGKMLNKGTANVRSVTSISGFGVSDQVPEK